MVFPVIGGDGKPTGYEIENSLRVNHGDSPFLSRSISSTGNERTATVSVWVKRALFGTEHTIFSNKISSAGSNCFKFVFFNDDELSIQIGTTGNSNTTLTTNRKFRDPSAWYHLMAVIDTTQSTSSNRVRIYVNGEEETSFSSTEYPSQNADMRISNSSFPHTIGEDPRDNTHFNGYLSEMYFIDGTALTPSSFGETDDNGVWIPKDAKDDLTFGTNGFYMEFKQTGTSQNSSGIGADTSGNDNHFAVTNLAATDVTIDTPTNNFCTLNPLHKSTSDVVLSEGNLKLVSGYSSGWQHAAGTMAVKNGKWYWEAKALNVAATDKTSIGVVEFDTDGVNFINNTNKDIINQNTAGITGHGAGVGSYTYAQGDIINVAMDMDNNKIYYGKNGTYFGNLNPAAGSGSTTQTVNNSRFSVPVVGGYGDSSWEMNFGVPQFSISSGNADANGYGNFEYAVPSGFYSLCTKNLAEYG